MHLPVWVLVWSYLHGTAQGEGYGVTLMGGGVLKCLLSPEHDWQCCLLSGEMRRKALGETDLDPRGLPRSHSSGLLGDGIRGGSKSGLPLLETPCLCSDSPIDLWGRALGWRPGWGQGGYGSSPNSTSTVFKNVGTRMGGVGGGYGLALCLPTLGYIHPPIYMVRGNISLESWLAPALSPVGI